MKVAVIPARGGSKRIPGKNIRPFCGKPMMAWSIEAAQSCGCFDRIILSTDDPQIAEVGRSLGAEVPFMRPPELSDDHAGTIPVIGHAVRFLEDEGVKMQAVCCIYATAPFVRPGDLRQGLRILQESGGDFAFSATSFEFPIQRAIRIDAEGRVRMFDSTQFNVRSQDLEPAYHDAGQFYWGRPEAWTLGRMVFSPESRVVMLPRHLVQDIDTPEDWERAEWMFQALQRRAPSA